MTWIDGKPVGVEDHDGKRPVRDHHLDADVPAGAHGVIRHNDVANELLAVLQARHALLAFNDLRVASLLIITSWRQYLGKYLATGETCGPS